MAHVRQFLDKKADGKGLYKKLNIQTQNIFVGLGYWSEQAFESVHADFKAEWESVKVDIDHPDYLDKLVKCIARWNARHI